MPSSHQMRAGYQSRSEPDYFHDTDLAGVLYQPEVYTDVARIADALGATRIIDVGCGNGSKLAALADRFEIVGIDYGANIEHCRRTHQVGTWLEDDFDVPGELPVDGAGAVLLCADVIEHVKDPAVLLGKLHGAFRLAREALAVMISTPEREVTHGMGHNGPPRNKAHVREWTIRELAILLRRSGFETGTIGLTRNNDRENLAATILGVYVRDPANLETVEDVLLDSPRPSEQPRVELGTVAKARRKLSETISPN